MMLGKKWMSLFMVLIPVLFLAACGASTEEKVIGSWKAVADGETGQYIEIGEERLLNRSESVSAEYILTETQSDSFLIELINPEDGVPFPFFEGHFEGEDNIKLEKMMGEPIENAEFVRVDNMEEEQAKDEKAQEEAEEEKRAAEDAEKQEEVAQAEAETVEDDELKDFTAASEYIIELIDNGRLGEAEERLKLLGESFTSEEYISSLRAMDDMIESAKYEKEQEKNSRDDNSLKEEYVQKAKMLDEEIEQIHNGPAPVGVYGDYLEDWDGLLNEVWGVLADTMPEEQFEQLKQDQIKWVQEKDADFEKARGEIDAKDRLTNTTRERTYYLIENYLGV